jgi:hypothetical protein
MRPNRFDAQGFGIINLLGCLLTFLAGLVLLFIKRTKRIGEGVLLGTGILLLTGLFVCGNGSFK